MRKNFTIKEFNFIRQCYLSRATLEKLEKYFDSSNSDFYVSTEGLACLDFINITERAKLLRLAKFYDKFLNDMIKISRNIKIKKFKKDITSIKKRILNFSKNGTNLTNVEIVEQLKGINNMLYEFETDIVIVLESLADLDCIGIWDIYDETV